MYALGVGLNGREPGNNHFDGSNWLYADGHVKFVRLSQSGTAANQYLWRRVKP